MFLFRMLRRIRLLPLRDAFLLDQCTHTVQSHNAVRFPSQPRIEDFKTAMLPVITSPHIETQSQDDEDAHKTRKMYKVWHRTNGGRAAEKHIIFTDGARFVCEP